MVAFAKKTEYAHIGSLSTGKSKPRLTAFQNGNGALQRRIMDLGLLRGVELLVRKVAPLGDPMAINVRGYELSLRKSEAGIIVIE